MTPRATNRGFTLIELLVVIAIVAVLAVTVILTLNPAQLLAQARDSRRISELTSLNSALALYQTDFSQASMGSTSVVYLSLPDSSPTCASWTSLAGLPAGWSYACKPTSTYQAVDGTGWIPANIAQLPSAPLSELPADPTAGYYYSYIVDANGKYALSAGLESVKYLASNAAADGGVDPARAEVGTNLQVAAGLSGLAGYWSLDEGSGTSIADGSGNGNAGTMSTSAPAWASGASCKRGNCLVFNGSQFVVIPNASSLNTSNVSIAVWFKSTSTPSSDQWIVFRLFGGYGYGLAQSTSNLAAYACNAIPGYATSNTTVLNNGQWHQLVGVYNGSQAKLYVDGSLKSTQTAASAWAPAGTLNIGNLFADGSNHGIIGSVDEVRQYNRALSASDVLNLYNSGQ